MFSRKKATHPAMRYQTPEDPSDGISSRKKIRSIPAVPRHDFGEFTCSGDIGTLPEPKAGVIRNATLSADAGYGADQTVLYRFLLENEPVISAHLQTRIQAVLACDWSVHCEDHAKEVRVAGILQHAGIYSLLRHLMNALAFGYAGSVILWEPGGTIRKFLPVASSAWSFDLAGNAALTDLSGKIHPLGEYHPNQFILHTHCIQDTIPSRGGLLRPLLRLFFFKYYGMRDRARFLEKFGIPFLIAKIREDDFEDEAVRTSILKSLSHMGTDGAGVVTEGSELQIISSASGAGGEFNSWMSYIDHLYALLILGQTASSSDGGGFSKGQIQENVRLDLLEADCRNLMESVNRQVIAPLERFLYGSEGTLRFMLDFSTPGNLSERAKIVQELAGAGFHADPEWIKKTFSIELEEK